MSGLRGTLPDILAKATALADSIRARLQLVTDEWHLHERKAEAARDVLVKATALRDFIVRVDERPQLRDDEYYDELIEHYSAMGAAVTHLAAVAADVDGARA